MKLLVHMTEEDFRNDLRSIFAETIKGIAPQQTIISEPEYLTRQETASKFKISLVTLNRLTNSGILTSYKIGGRVLYRADQINSALSDNPKKYRR